MVAWWVTSPRTPATRAHRAADIYIVRVVREDTWHEVTCSQTGALPSWCDLSCCRRMTVVVLVCCWTTASPAQQHYNTRYSSFHCETRDVGVWCVHFPVFRPSVHNNSTQYLNLKYLAFYNFCFCFNFINIYEFIDPPRHNTLTLCRQTRTLPLVTTYIRIS